MRRAVSRAWCLSIAWAVAGSMIGCGGASDPLNRQAVTGQVTLNNELLDSGSISFDPHDRAAGRPGGAVIENGKFKIERERGLPPGVYTVRVYSSDTESAPETVEEMPGESRKLAPERIPASWNSNSEKTITVEDGGDNQFELAIP